MAIERSRAARPATQALLREAWITGQLEHPNVIPVHALYRAEDAPLLVMKRVEGRAWSDHPREGGSLEILGVSGAVVLLMLGRTWKGDARRGPLPEASA